MVAAHRIPGWDDKPVPHKANKYPQPRDPDAPRNFSLSLWIGSRGSGKTMKAAMLLKKLEQTGVTFEGRTVDQRIILLSPTADANPVFTVLKNLAPEDVHPEFTEGKLKEIVEDIEHEKEESLLYQRRLKLWKRVIRMKDPDSMLTPEEVNELKAMNWDAPKKPKFPNGPAVNHLVCDDLVGSSIFKQGRNPFVTLCLKNRHLGINVMIMTQSLRCVNKAIRLNASLLVVFRYGNVKTVEDDIYEEVSGRLTPEQFMELYEHATQDPHSALVIDFSQPRDRVFKQNFDHVLRLDGKNTADYPHIPRYLSEQAVCYNYRHPDDDPDSSKNPKPLTGSRKRAAKRSSQNAADPVPHKFARKAPEDYIVNAVAVYDSREDAPPATVISSLISSLVESNEDDAGVPEPLTDPAVGELKLSEL
ncbi:hypothetical protein WJX72_009443 [[Myrmecia] bisecta]|uniref:Zona occludens toxin N-terminal domain-containing protein n=1 Tax=[Myrmecia] bisecta TaxID=41462 RepID=A0AAW1Q4W7_9CHLO